MTPTPKKRRQKMFISVLPGEQVEVIVAEEGIVREYYVEMMHQEKTKGNIYKGYIHNIDSSLQAAFINYGAERNGFLQVDEVHPEYYQGGYKLPKGARFPLLQKVLKPGQEVLVQVVKEPTGKKGAFLTTYLSLPGRSFVYTLGRGQLGVSRKIEDEKERARLKKILDSIEPESGVGLIVRTAGVGQSKSMLTNDYKYLNRVWKEIRRKAQDAKAPELMYQEMSLAMRAVRDYLTRDVTEIWVDDAQTAEKVTELVSLSFPRSSKLVKLHTDTERTLWERFNLNRQIMDIYSREVDLPSGGRLVFDQTEALTAIDVNSGRIGGERNFHKMALKTNMEAAEEIARQLRLRDLGGQVVIDFIEMKDPKHCREVEKTMRQAFKNDRARTDVGRVSAFGLMELVRQRLGSSALAVSTEPCPCCNGTGIRRNMEFQALSAIREIFCLLRKKNSPDIIEYPCNQELALYLLNHKWGKLKEMGQICGKEVQITIGTQIEPNLPQQS
ncbi:MAG: Rne/Rng family ribonuclease [Desulfovibrio sp.]